MGRTFAARFTLLTPELSRAEGVGLNELLGIMIWIFRCWRLGCLGMLVAKKDAKSNAKSDAKANT